MGTLATETAQARRYETLDMIWYEKAAMLSGVFALGCAADEGQRVSKRLWPYKRRLL